MSAFDDDEDRFTGLADGLRRPRRGLPPIPLGYTNPGDVVWTTNTGERIKLKDMSRSHRTNAYRMLVRNTSPEAVAISAIGRALADVGIDL